MDELKAVNREYMRIMQIMAHDLRGPLSGITGFAAILLDEMQFSSEHKNMIRLIESTGIHSLEMIDELLKNGFMDENQVLEKEELDINALLNDSVELMQFRANNKTQQLNMKSENNPILIKANYEKIWRVINNLIINAIKFSYSNSEINIGLSSDYNGVQIFVADNGIGIPANSKDRIFDMFTSAKRYGTNGEQPFGLGLSISKKIIDMHNGKIWFENNVDGGTVFHVALPYL
ncbi:sensor histidine kinase [Mucilaginibacter sp.]